MKAVLGSSVVAWTSGRVRVSKAWVSTAVAASVAKRLEQWAGAREAVVGPQGAGRTAPA
jgi:hypothetical protein